MKKALLTIFFTCLFFSRVSADRIYIMNATGYNTAASNLVTAMTGLGHTVVVNNLPVSLPVGLTSTCVNAATGYDWLCFFGNNNFSIFSAQIAAYIDVGGKVFYQYEVSCCDVASASAATLASILTGLAITPNANPYIALKVIGPGWTASIAGCINLSGNAYKGMDGLPVANQLQATANTPGSSPSITLCPNYGFVFCKTDFISGAGQGAIVGVGDINIWYDGAEPSGTVNVALVNFFFPNASSTCYLFPPGCNSNGPCTPLAAGLLNFQAEYIGNKVSLSWTVSEGSGCGNYELERSFDAINFEPFAKINCRGQGETENYSSEDEAYFAGRCYYMLKHMDEDGHLQFANVQSVFITYAESFVISPNPVMDGENIHIEFTSLNIQEADIIIRSMTGNILLKETRSLEKGMNKLEINTSSLSAGIYFLECRSKDGVEKVKVVVQ